MTLVLVVAALVGLWAWKSGELRAIRMADVAAVVAALAAIRFFSQGNLAMAAVAGLGAGAWYWHRRNATGPEPAAMPLEEARRLLDVPADAGASDIRAAHRRLAARVHPDAGGSSELAAKVNAARDTLIAELNRRTPRAS